MTLERNLKLQMSLDRSSGTNGRRTNEHPRSAISLPAGLKPLEIPRHDSRLIPIIKTNIRLMLGNGRACHAHRRAGLHPSRAKRLNPVGADIHPSCRLMASKTRKLAPTTRERVMKRKTPRTAHRTAPRGPVEPNHDGRTTKLRSHSPSDNPHDAGMPTLTREDQTRSILPTVCLYLAERLTDHLFLDRATLRRQLLNGRGNSSRTRRIALEQERERKIWIPKPARRVQTGRDAKSDVVGGHSMRQIKLRKLSEGA